VPVSDTVQVASAADAPVLPMPAPNFRSSPDDEAPADPQIGIGDADSVDTVASIAPEPVLRPVDLGMPPAIDAANTLAGVKRKKPDVVGAFTSAYSLGAAPAPLGQTRPSTPLIPPVGIGDQGQPIDLMTSGSITGDVAAVPATDAPAQDPAIVQVADAGPVQTMPAALPQGWIVQTGANGLISNAADQVAALAKFDGFVQRFEKDGQTYFRARFGGFSGQDAANDMCKQLKQAKMSCLAMQS
jgi:D-alanyl-D-alanine carboxypeptidase